MLSLSPLLSLLLAQSTPAPTAVPSWPAEFAASGSLGRFSQGDSYSGWHGGGSAAVTWFVGRPLVDDGATPLSMQSFLQRLNRLSLEVGASAWSGKDDLTLHQRSANTVDASAAGRFYLGSLVLGGELLYARVRDRQLLPPEATEEKHTTDLGHVGATLGWRYQGDVELSGTYRWKGYYDDGVSRAPRWGQVILRLRSLAESNVYWAFGAYTLVHGGGGSFQTEVFFNRRLGVWLTGFYERGQMYVNSEVDYMRQGASVGFGAWASNRFEVQFSLGFSTVERASSSAVALTEVTTGLTFVLRAPQRYRAWESPPPPPALAPPPHSPPRPAEIPPPENMAPPEGIPVPAEDAPGGPEEAGGSPQELPTPAEPSPPDAGPPPSTEP